MPDKIKEAFTAINDKELFLDEQDFRDNVMKDPKGTFEALNNYGKTKGFFLDYGDFESALDLKKKEPTAPSIPNFSTSLGGDMQPLPSGAKNISQSPLQSNIKTEFPTYIDPTKPLKTKEVIDVNAEKKPFDSEVIRKEREVRLGTHREKIMSSIVKEPDLYTKKASKSHYGTIAVPEMPNIDNISKAIDYYATKLVKQGEYLSPLDKQYLVNSVAQQVKQRKNIADAAANASLRAINRKELPEYAYTGVTNAKGEVLVKGLFQEANEKIINEQNKEVDNYKINSENLTKTVATEVAPEVNALKLDVKAKAEILNQEVETAFNKSFNEKDKAMYDQYNQLVQSGQMTPDVANNALKIKREELQKQTQAEISAAYAPKFDALNKESNLKSKDIQSTYNRNYLAKANLLKETTNKKLQEIAQKNMVNMPKGYMERWAKDFQESLAEIEKKNVNQAYLDAKRMPAEARLAKAVSFGFGNVLGSIGGAMSFAGLDASAVNDVVIKTTMQNELTSSAYYRIKDEEAKANGTPHANFVEKLSDPSWWYDNMGSTAPFMLVTMPVGIASGYGAGSIAKLLGASKRATAIASAVGGGAVSWYGENTLEAGSAFNDAINQGYSENDASEIAARTFRNNIITLPLSVFQLMPVFSKSFKFTKALPLEIISGGVEEVFQGWSQAEANAAANGYDVSLFEYAKTPQALEEGTIGGAMQAGMAMFALNETPNIDKQISALMSSISVGGEQYARAVLDVMNKNQAITDAEFKEANLQIDYILNGIESVQNFNVDDNLKAGLVGKFAKIGRAKALITDDENDLASQAAKEMIAEQEKDIKEILKGNTPLYLVFQKGNPIPTLASEEQFNTILKDPKLREEFTLQAINDDALQSKIDETYKTGVVTEEETINAEQEIIPATETPAAPPSGVSGEVQASGDVEANIANRKRKDLFPDKSRFANDVGQSGENSQISSYKEVNGIGLSEYSNPKNGLVDVIMTGTSDNDYVGYIRIYENGKPTNRWTSKMSNKSGNKGNFKTMITEAQKLLPEGHEYTETTNISLDGLRVYANSLSRDYEIATDEDGKPITNNVELNNATLAALQGAKNQQETEDLFDTKRGITRDEFNQIKEQVNKLLPNTRLLFDTANGIVTIQLPVLKSTKKQLTTNEQQKASKKVAEVTPKEGDSVIIKSRFGRDEKLVFNKGEWRVQFGKDEFSDIGKAAQQEAQDAFNKKNEPVAEVKEQAPVVKEQAPNRAEGNVKVKSFKQGDGGTKGVFEGEDGKLYKSIEPQESVQDKEGNFKRQTIKDTLTDEHKILSELQDNPHVPKVGKIVDTTEGKAFEIEKLDEVDTFTKDEYREIQKILNDLNDKGYHVGDRVTVMKRPKTGELVIIDFSAGYKGSRMSRDADEYMGDVAKKLSKSDAINIKLEDLSEINREQADAFFDKESTTEYYLTQRPPSIGTHPTEGLLSVNEAEYRNRKNVYILKYDRKLTPNEIANFELTPKVTNKEFLGQKILGVYGKVPFYVTKIDYKNGTVKMAAEVVGKEVEKEISFREFSKNIDEGKYKVETPKEEKPVKEQKEPVKEQTEKEKAKEKAKEELRARAAKAKAEAISAAQKVQQALEATGITVEVVDSEQEFQDKLDAEGVNRASSAGKSGVFISKSGKIFINGSKVDANWGSVDVWHEGTHPIINIIRNTNPKLYNSIIDGLNKLVTSNPEIADVLKWAQKNYKGKNTLEDETITETIARIANGNIDISKIPTSLRDKIIDFINEIAKSLGIKPMFKSSNVATFKKIAGEISAALKEGKDISSIVGAENVKNYESKITIEDSESYVKKANESETSEGINNENISISDISGNSRKGIQFSKGKERTEEKAKETVEDKIKAETIKAVKKSILDYKSLKGKISRTLFYDNTRVGSLEIKNRITGYTPPVMGKGGFFYSYMPSSLKNKAVLAFTSINQAIQTLKRQMLYPDGLQAIAAQNFQTAHLGNKSTLEALFGKSGSENLGIFQDSVKDVKNNPNGEAELLETLKKATIDIANQKVQSGVNEGKPTASAEEIKKIIERNGGNLDGIKSLDDYRDKVLTFTGGDSFGARNILFTEVLQEKPTKITKSTRESHQIIHYKYGIPTLSEIAEGNNQSELNNAETGDVVKFVKPYTDPVVYTTDKKIYKQYSENPTPEMVENGIKIKLLPKDAAHESYAFVLKGENVGLLDNYISATQLYEKNEKIANTPKKQSFYKVGRMPANAEAGVYPENPIAQGKAQYSQGNRDAVANKNTEKNNIIIKDNNIEGKLLNNQESQKLQKEIESKYNDSGIQKFGQENEDIRQNLYNYDNPLAEKDVNGINIRIAEGLLEGDKYSGNRKKTYLLYADGKIAGKFYSVADAKKVVSFIEQNLIKPKSLAPSNPQYSQGNRDAVANENLINGFYSPLEKTINDSKQDKMPAKQWIEKFAKGEEAKWTGLTDWLSSQTGSVSKADIQQYLKDNRIEIEEKVKGSSDWIKEGKSYFSQNKKYEIRDLGDNEYTVIKDGRYNLGSRDGLERAKELAFEDGYSNEEDINNDTNFGNRPDLQLEGEKENYKEILVTLPNKEAIKESEIEEKRRKAGIMDNFNFETMGYNDTRNVPKFVSSHFDEPNILVHLRMNTRIDSNGNKVLLIEEAQSDWGQTGKKKGFKPTFEIRNEKGMFNVYSSVNNMKEPAFSFDTKEDANKMLETLNKTNESKVPTAPFVMDTNAWAKLGLKVALKEAVAQGVDKIAWTTGEQQNDRYDLSKQVDEINYSKNSDGTYDVSANKNDNQVFDKSYIKENELEGIVGKEVAQRIINNEGKEPVRGSGNYKKSLSGDGLKVGGKGMKGFYGSPTEGKLGIVGEVAKSLFKQEPKTVSIEGILSFNVYDNKDGNLQGNFADFNSAKEFAKKIDGSVQKTNISTQNSIDITPELKAQVEEGLPQFSQGSRDIQSLVDIITETQEKGQLDDNEIAETLEASYSKEEIQEAFDYINNPPINEPTATETVEPSKVESEKVVNSLNTAEVEAVAKALAKEEKKGFDKTNNTERNNARNKEAEKELKDLENAATVLAITQNINEIRAKLLENGNIKTIDCKWG
jgi:hypothetical protein